MQTEAFLYTLIQLAKAEAEARKSGDPDLIAQAHAEHMAYRQVCLEADVLRLEIVPLYLP